MLLLKNASTDSSPKETTSELSPLPEQSDEIGSPTVSSSQQIETIANDEPLQSKRMSSSIAVDVNHDDKQVIVEVLATPIDEVDTAGALTLSSSSSIFPPECTENANKSANNGETGLEFVDYSVLECEKFDAGTENWPTLNELSDAAMDQTASQLNTDKSYEVSINDLMAVQLTPTMQKRTSFGKRTPIGMIRLKTNDFASVASTEAYEIVMVQKDHISPMKKVRTSSVVSTIDETIDEKGPIGAPYPLHNMNNEIASKATASDHRFPTAPKIILQRINELKAYGLEVMPFNQNTCNSLVKPKRAKPKPREKRQTGKFKRFERAKHRFSHLIHSTFFWKI